MNLTGDKEEQVAFLKSILVGVAEESSPAISSVLMNKTGVQIIEGIDNNALGEFVVFVTADLVNEMEFANIEDPAMDSESEKTFVGIAVAFITGMLVMKQLRDKEE